MTAEPARGDRGEGDDELSRRRFLELLAISIATASAAACKRAPDERIVSQVDEAPGSAPGVPRWYATSIVEEGLAIGLLAESRDGRPTKIEGNPRHPSSLGGTLAHHQAWVLQLYDPARAQAIESHGFPASRRAFLEHLSTLGARARDARGRGLHVVLEPTSSALTIDRVTRLRELLPEARVWFDGERAPLSAHRGAARAFGRVVEVELDLAKADLLVDLDADSLASGEHALVHARAFGRRRKLRSPHEAPPRSWVVEPALTPTGTLADARRAMRASEIGPFVAALLAEVVELRGDAPVPEPVRRALGAAPRPPDPFRSALARSLVEHRGGAAIAIGAGQPEAVHVLAHALRALVGERVTTHRPSPILEAGAQSFSRDGLVSALDAGDVEVLALLSVNPSYAAPSDVAFAERAAKAKERIVLGSYRDETGEAATWQVPALHGLERWGEARAKDGTISLIQPLIAPLVAGVTETELLAWLSGEHDFDPYRALRARLAAHVDREGGFERALQRGIVEGSASAPVTPPLDWDAVADAANEVSREVPAGLEIVYPIDPRTQDGRFANVAWLLELPHPITKLTWENAARVSPTTAKRFELANEDVIELALPGGRSLEVPVVIAPGDADDVVTLSRGWGRRSKAEALARGLGVDANRLRVARAPHHELGLSLRKTGRARALAITQRETSLHDRGEHVARARTLEEWRAQPPVEHAPKPSLYKLPLAGSPLGNQWGMVVDLAACTGCSACVVACQAENNVPTVGKTGVRMGREMHWLRIDTYVSGDPAAPRVIQQPMLCQHCEKAPCEYVCPVNATVHSPDGLNEQAYQRCVGTRFCSANCPYKVRRFNWFRYHHPSETQKLVYNPDVTVRERGVMEKCSFCVQRIRRGEIAARLANRPLRDAEIVTACQQACPTEAIVFGSIADPRAEVSSWRASERAFAALEELGTEPRVRYLAKLWDPPPIEGEKTTAAPAPREGDDEGGG